MKLITELSIVIGYKDTVQASAKIMYVSPATLYLHLVPWLHPKKDLFRHQNEQANRQTIRSSRTKICKWHNVRNQETQVWCQTKVNVSVSRECRMREKMFQLLKTTFLLELNEKYRCQIKQPLNETRLIGIIGILQKNIQLAKTSHLTLLLNHVQDLRLLHHQSRKSHVISTRT